MVATVRAMTRDSGSTLAEPYLRRRTADAGGEAAERRAGRA